MANISVVGRIVSDDIELKISANNRPIYGSTLRSVPVRGLTQERSIIRSLPLGLLPHSSPKEACAAVR